MRFFLVLLLLPFCSLAKDIYQIHPLSEREVLKTYTLVLRDACRHADQDWKSSASDPAVGYWGDGVSSGNQGIRTIANMVLASGTLLKYDDGLSEGERRELLAKATAALRYATATHVTGTQKCTNGKQWGATEKFGSESWQSGMWTGTLLFGAWLMWDKLEPGLQEGIQRVVASEDDILAKRTPPTGLWLDTKAEENGWEVPCLVLGELMFPSHPHAAAWHETAQKYMMNTLCTAADLEDTSLVDGRAVNQWVQGANLQPDFTLENHNKFHPAYVGCSSYFLTQAAMYYTYAGRPIPQAAAHHLMDTWRMFQTVLLPWGEAAYPQGMDWELHALPYLNLFATLATHGKDPLAAHFEQRSLQYLRAWQVMKQGDLAVPGSKLGITRHSVNAEQAAYGFIAHKVFRPATKELSDRAATTCDQGVWEYRYVDFVVHRTGKKFVTFSWKNQIMGQLIPIGEGHEGNPEFTVPILNGLVGSFELAPAGDAKMTVQEHSWKKTLDGFETTGTLLINGGRLKQTVKVTSIGEQAVVYQDQVTAVKDVTVKKALGVPVGIENDQISGGMRVVSDQDGQIIFDAQKPRQLAAIPGAWVNVDGRLGVVMMAGEGMAYAQASGYSPGISVCADSLYGSYSDQPKKFKAGEEAAHRVVIFFVEATAKETSALAKLCRIEEKSGGKVLRFKQGKKVVEVPLF
ncbi:hypothetical protein [Pedosphaera parvula]|uniref:Uncharacterized protein n=1 Tax=Pedosphaera parvula (strain Ellin514) TaxID=320771 RepID=B9XHT2_PEDPL|nr:hypothetical protein [Pedosphaera parvula]EEF60660.1 hypothetical protein Cflav_PD6251 [Pedosphaera parvula Ellin514]